MALAGSIRKKAGIEKQQNTVVGYKVHVSERNPHQNHFLINHSLEMVSKLSLMALLGLNVNVLLVF